MNYTTRIQSGTAKRVTPISAIKLIWNTIDYGSKEHKHNVEKVGCTIDVGCNNYRCTIDVGCIIIIIHVDAQ
jgi:hypothetical protein